MSDFTQRELEIMAKAWNCMTEEPKVNYEKLAELTGMTNPRSASNAWASIKKKIMAKGGISKETNGENGGTGTPKKTPKATPASKKRSKKDGDNDGAAAEESPTKKAKGRKSKAAKSEEKVEEGEDEVNGAEDAGATPVKQEGGDDSFF